MNGIWYFCEFDNSSKLKNTLKAIIEYSKSEENFQDKLNDLFFIKKELKQYMLKNIKQIYIIDKKHILLVITNQKGFNIFLKEMNEKQNKLISRLENENFINLKEEIENLKIYKTTSKWKKSDIY